MHSPSLRAARLTTAVVFLVSGAVYGSLASRLPDLKATADLSDGAFGVALLGFPLGTVVALPLVSRALARFGSGPVTRVTALAYPPVAVLPSLGVDQWSLLATLTAFGLVSGALDTAMNAHAITVERRYGRSIMSSLHAFYSLGGLVGALLGAVLVHFGLVPMEQFSVLGSLFLALLLVRLPRLLPGGADAHDDDTHGEFAAPWTMLTVLTGLVAFCSFVGEGAAGDWSGVHMAQVLGVSTTVAALGYAAYSAAMCAGRFVNDGLVDRFGPVPVLRLGGVVAAIGVVAVVTADGATAAIIGWALVGVGLSSAAPLAFTAAGHLPGVAMGPAVARVTALGYAGVMIGPPIIGGVADVTSLPVALLIPGVLALMFIPLAPVLRR